MLKVVLIKDVQCFESFLIAKLKDTATARTYIKGVQDAWKLLGLTADVQGTEEGFEVTVKYKEL